MKYLYYCPGCNFFGSAEHRVPTEQQLCDDCKTEMIYMGYSKPEWDKFSPNEKTSIKVKFIDQYAQLLVTNGFNFEGHRITGYLGLVSGSVVLGTGVFSEFFAGVSDFFGSQNYEFSQKIERARMAAISHLKRNAKSLGANAVIGIDVDIAIFTGNMVAVIANGTAVTICSTDK
ncbi:MAG: YbjQ family protein [Clostridiales bacterium]|nr:YbjQ family protein [Clostridiales bacterium]